MATVNQNAAPSPGDPPTVFSAANDRRERALHAAGRLVAVVVGVWLLALLAGAMGFGHLPGLPGAGLLDAAARPGVTPRKTPAANPAIGGNQSLASRTVGPESRRAGSPSAKGRTPAQRTPPAAQPPSPAQPIPPPPVTPPSPGKPRGRAVRRHGIHAPTPPPPANGNANGQGVVNRGRAKHALPPPPPPPPPPPKKP